MWINYKWIIVFCNSKVCDKFLVLFLYLNFKIKQFFCFANLLFQVRIARKSILWMVKSVRPSKCMSALQSWSYFRSNKSKIEIINKIYIFIDKNLYTVSIRIFVICVFSFNNLFCFFFPIFSQCTWQCRFYEKIS